MKCSVQNYSWSVASQAKLSNIVHDGWTTQPRRASVQIKCDTNLSATLTEIATPWRKAGADLPVRIVVVAPTGYRLCKGGKLLYRQPAYLLCTDLDMPIQELLQYYLWRWDIEVNHRDEKQIIGVGQAQVWSPRSVDRQPMLAVASYAYCLVTPKDLVGWPISGGGEHDDRGRIASSNERCGS